MISSTLLGVAVATSHARVLCEKRRSGVVVVREACRPKERPLDIAQFGAVGPQGPQGEPGPPGQTAVYSVVTSAPTGFAALTSEGIREPIASLSLPPGSYVLSADVTVSPEGAVEWFVGCAIVAATSSESRQLIQPPSARSAMLSVQFTATLAEETTVALRCGDAETQPAGWSDASLNAVRVDAINPP